MQQPIPSVIYRIGDLKGLFAQVRDKYVGEMRQEKIGSPCEETLSECLAKSVTKSLTLLGHFKDADYITLPDKPAELGTALDPHTTKPFHAYYCANEYRIIPEAAASTVVPTVRALAVK